MQQIDRYSLVLEHTQCRPDYSSLDTLRVALPHPSIINFFTRKPAAPGRGATRTVLTGILQHGIGIDQFAIRVEAQRPAPPLPSPSSLLDT